MNRRQPLILVDNPELVSSGLWPDRHPVQTPLWEVAENVEFAGGRVVRRVPNTVIPTAATAGPPSGIGQLQASNGVRWLYFTVAGGIYRWFGPAAEHIINLPGFVQDQNSLTHPTFFDFVPWGNWMVINMGGPFQPIIYKPEFDVGVDDGTRYFINFAGFPPLDPVIMLKKRNQLVAIGHGNNRRLVSVSDADDIENWDYADPNTLALQLPLEELTTPVRSACHFGPSIAVFGENQMFEVKWIGAPFYYGQNKLLDGIGCIGKLACCSDARIVYGFGRNGAWKTDGTQYSYIDEVVLRTYLQDNINWSQSGKIAVRKNDISGCIEYSFPMGESLENNEGWAYDPRYGGWSKVPPFRVMENRVLFDAPVQGKPGVGAIFELVGGNPAALGDLELETKAMLIQRDNNALHIGALIDEIELMVHRAENVQFQYGVAEYPSGPFSWTNPHEITTKQTTHKLDQRVSGTYHKLKFSNYEQNWTLDLQGFALFGDAEGLKREKL